MWQLASAGVRAHRGTYAGTAVVLAVASAVLAVTGVLLESGLRLQASGAAAGALLVGLASSYAGTLLVVVVMVVAATVSLALRGRRRELALLRAVGATPAQVRRAVTLEVAVVSLVAAPAGAVLGLVGARLLDPVLVRSGLVAADFAVSLSPLPVLAAVLLLVVTAVPVGRLGAREAATTAPTAALQLSAVEGRVGAGRRVAALALTVAGLGAAFSALWVPGATGSAAAGLSAFLLVGAAALAGPVLVGWVFDRLARVGPSTGHPAAMLAVRNVRGFSRRLTTVVVPLALVVAAATVQTSVNRAIATGAEQELTAAITADLVVTPGADVAPDLTARVAAAPGVASAVPLATVPAEVRTDTDVSGPLAWEATALRVVPGGTPAFDPAVVRGSLADVDTVDTVAVSTDTAFQTGAGLGETLTLRLGDDVVDATVVAVFSRGLGAGGVIAGPATAAAHGLPVVVDSVLVDVVPGADAAQVAAEVVALGATAVDVETYVAGATGAGGENEIGVVLLLLLLAVVAVGAVSTLAMTTASRRDELALLHRTGTTRRQLLAMTTVEAAVTGVTAWVLGTVAVVPAVVGVSAAVVAGPPVVDVVTYAVVGAAVVVLALVATGLAARRTTRLATAVR